MADNATTSWKEELSGIEQQKFEERFKTGEFDDLMFEDEEFRNAVNTGALFKKEDNVPAIDEMPQDGDAENVPDRASGETPKQDDLPRWKQLGFASEEEFYQKYDALAKITSQPQVTGDIEQESIQEAKAAEQRAQQLERELAELRAKVDQSDSTVKVPEMPEFPVAPDDDPTDPNYVKAQQEYAKKLRSWGSSIGRVLGETTMALQEERKRSSTISDEFSKIRSRAEEEEARLKEQKAVSAFNGLLEEVAQFQQECPEYQTATPFAKINEAVRTAGWERASAAFPERDMGNYRKLVELIRQYKTFDERGNLDLNAPGHYKTLDEVHLINLRRQGKLDDHYKRKLTEAEKRARTEVIDALDRTEQGATTLPAGGDLSDTAKEKTTEEKMRLYTELSKMSDSEINADGNLKSQYVQLADDLGFGSSVPTAWRKQIAS